MCGEQEMLINTPQPIVGSSPRVQGTVRAACAIACVVGIIPACAGNSASRLYGHRRP